MKIDLQGKTAAVTGSTAGIGYAIARGLAQAGARVVINGRTPDKVGSAVIRLRTESGSALVSGVAADLGTAEGCSAFARVEPSADVLVNNVGMFGLRDYFDTPDELWENFFSVKRVAGSGVTVNTILPRPTLSDGLQTMLHEEQRKSGRAMESIAADFVKAHRPSSIIRRPATVEEVASLVVYVASAQASATTGAALRVDGGVIDTIA